MNFWAEALYPVRLTFKGVSVKQSLEKHTVYGSLWKTQNVWAQDSYPVMQLTGCACVTWTLCHPKELGQNADILSAAISVNNKLCFISDPGASCLLSSMKW